MFSRNNMSNTCISLVSGDQKNVIVIDDLYNIGKSNISQLVKLFDREDRTSEKEPYFSIPIICINNIVTIKINELQRMSFSHL